MVRRRGEPPASPPGEQRRLLRTLAAAGRIGGPASDAVVGLTAKRAGALLVTADARAAAVYDLIGVEQRLLEHSTG